MFEAVATGEGDPFADVVAGLPAEPEEPGGDLEFQAWVGAVLAGHDDPVGVDLGVEQAWMVRADAALAAVLGEDVAGSPDVSTAVVSPGALPSVVSPGVPAPDVCPDAPAAVVSPETPTAAVASGSPTSGVSSGPLTSAESPDAPTSVASPCAATSSGSPVVADLGEEGLLVALQDAHRQIAVAQARRAVVITELAYRRAREAVTELTGRKAKGVQALGIAARAVGEEVSLELSLSKSAAAALVDVCVGLSTEAPDTLDHLAGGRIDWDKAAAIVGLTQTLRHAQAETNPDLDPGEQTDPQALARALEGDLLEKAGSGACQMACGSDSS